MSPPVKQNDNLKVHTDNWFACMRSRKTPNGNIETGFAHSIAVIMATRSYREGKKIYWDRKSEQISYNVGYPSHASGVFQTSVHAAASKLTCILLSVSSFFFKEN